MKIESAGDNQIVIELSEDDLSSLEITYEEMDYSNIETRRVIWTLLDEARQTLGCDIDPSGKIMIEAVPKDVGGCEIRFTVMPEAKTSPKKMILKKGIEPLICEFSDTNNLIDASRAIVKNGLCDFKSELYSDNSLFYLIVYPQNSRVASLLSEYTTVCSKGEPNASLVREHFFSICPENAIQKLATDYCDF